MVPLLGARGQLAASVLYVVVMEIVLTPPPHPPRSFLCPPSLYSKRFFHSVSIWKKTKKKKRKKIKPKSLCSSENSHTPLLEDAVTQMTPEEHYRRMMSALNEHGTFEEQQQQRLYQLANSMAVPSHGGTGTGGHQGFGYGL